VIDAFRCVFPDRARGKRWVLVDDVRTTGATLGACAQALLAAGAAQVHSIVLAVAL
jgi:predicted amidophosphoribosyltransferase